MESDNVTTTLNIGVKLEIRLSVIIFLVLLSENSSSFLLNFSCVSLIFFMAAAPPSFPSEKLGNGLNFNKKFAQFLS